MYAMLIHKKVSADGLTTSFAFCDRSMTCYNGMNGENVMAPQFNGNSLYVTLPTARLVDGQPAISDIEFIAGAQLHGQAPADLRSVAGWVLLGLGYLNDKLASQPAGSTIEEYRMALINQRGAGTYSNLAPYVGHLLKRESIFGQYYDAVLQENKATVRPRTDNEKMVARVISGICLNNGHGMGNRNRFDAEVARRAAELHRGSFPFRAMFGYETFDGQTFEIVGSERPSGLAVTYLQAWRNTVQMWTQKPASHSFLLGLRNQGHPSESMLPVLSALYQGSDDSDILSYAGVPFQHAVFKHGIWKLARFYRDQRTMTAEGRYNKGGQSSAIRDNIHRLVPEGFPAVTGQVDLLTLSQGFHRIGNMIQHFSPQNMAAYHYDLQALNAAWTQRDGRGSAQISPSNMLTSFIVQARSRVSYLPPATPALNTDGASQGFTAWVATAEATVH